MIYHDLMSLGEAFIEIHADLRPFARDLRRDAKIILEAFEREVKAAVQRTMGGHSEEEGSRIGDRVSRGIKKSLVHQLGQKNAFIVIASTLAGALDDGISALPTEVKAAIVAGVLAASPLVAGALAGLVTAGLGVAVTGLGVALASQFEQVQTRATEFGRNIRTTLVESAAAFVPAIFGAFNMIESRIARLRPLLEKIFNVSAGFLEPLLQGVLNALESTIDVIADNIGNIEPFVQDLGAAFGILGQSIAQALGILIATGEDGRKAMLDFVSLIGIAIVSVASLIFALARLYGAFRTVVKIIADLTGPLLTVFTIIKLFFDEVDRRSNLLKQFTNTNTDAANGFDFLIKATKGETDALKDYRDALINASNATKNQLELSIDWEESLDRVSDALDRNGKNLDIRTEKGRESARAFLEALKIAEDAAVQRVRRGEQTGEEAALSYDKEIARLRTLAHEAGISDQAFNDLFEQIILVGEARISSTEMGVDNLSGELGDANNRAAELYATLQTIKALSRFGAAGLLGGIRGMADGGVLNFPETIRAAESGPEVIIPLTKPARASQLLAQTGLDRMLGGGGTGQVLVFIGNEQLDSRMVRIVERSTQVQALALNHGGRAL